MVKSNIQNKNIYHSQKVILGWSLELENILKKQYPEIFDNPKSNGTFQLKNKGRYWYYKFSSGTKNNPRYLCGTQPKDLGNDTSFVYAFSKLKLKLLTEWKIGNKDIKFLHSYILLYMKYLAKRGGYYFDEEKGRLFKDTEIVKITSNRITTKNKVQSINQFYNYCKKNDILISSVGSREIKTIFKNYLEFTASREKLKSYKNLNGKTIGRLTMKEYLKQVRVFLDWLVKEKELGGLEMFNENPISIKFQTDLLKNYYGNETPILRNEFRKFNTDDYEKCMKDCITIVFNKWKTVCKNDGNKAVLRKGYYEQTNGNTKGSFHKNQSIDSPIGIDIVYFISLLQLRYGFRISEILHSFRNEHSAYRNKEGIEMKSYFVKIDTLKYEFYIENSKRKSRLIPIDECIRSFEHQPPIFKGKQLGKNKPYNDENGKKVNQWDTNIIDICMYLWPESDYLFSSPNIKAKPNTPYGLNYYLGLFKNRIVEHQKTITRNRKGVKHTETFDGLGWIDRGIESTHHLRQFFISYMIRKDGVEPLALSEITGHSLNTMLSFYKRLNLKSLSDNLMKNSIHSILSKKRFKQ